MTYVSNVLTELHEKKQTLVFHAPGKSDLAQLSVVMQRLGMREFAKREQNSTVTIDFIPMTVWILWERWKKAYAKEHAKVLTEGWCGDETVIDVIRRSDLAARRSE
jgi:hypothetical protein